jgi:hypothetical protein
MRHGGPSLGGSGLGHERFVLLRQEIKLRREYIIRPLELFCGSRELGYFLLQVFHQ